MIERELCCAHTFTFLCEQDCEKVEKLLGDNNGKYGKSRSLIIFRLEQTNIGIGVVNADTLLFFPSPILNCLYVPIAFCTFTYNI